MLESFDKKHEMWTTDIADQDEFMKAMEKFKELTDTNSCPMAVQGYVGIAALMIIQRLRGCCSQKMTMEATMFSLGMAIANIVSVLPEDEQKASLEQLDQFIYKCVQLRAGITDPRTTMTSQ